LELDPPAIEIVPENDPWNVLKIVRQNDSWSVHIVPEIDLGIDRNQSRDRSESISGSISGTRVCVLGIVLRSHKLRRDPEDRETIQLTK